MTVAPGDLITRPGQMQYGGLLLGSGTPYRWRDVTGWEELPALDSGDVARSDAHGSLPGLLLAQARTVGLVGLIIRAPRDRIGAVVGALNGGTVPRADEIPLVAWLDDRGPLLVHARAVRRSVPVGPGFRLGTIVGGAVEWVASDPRRYAVGEQTVTARLPAAEPGLTWPKTWPLNFGAPGSSGALVAMNAGDAPAHPVIEFRGPVTTPVLVNADTGDVLEYDIPLAAGDVLTVDTRAGTVLLNGGASRLGTASNRSAPEQVFALAPGINNLIFRAGPDSDPAATATVRFRSAYW
ncbi:MULTISPECIES: phage distal tail protein [Streptomyces]|uniref:phage distal tail protein n=1 Tax=Streptomyces TaxID=1883 RepID=UPI001F304AB1|nr:phage tail domain-containing protein [Streptomyces sp. CB02120-2]